MFSMKINVNPNLKKWNPHYFSVKLEPDGIYSISLNTQVRSYICPSLMRNIEQQGKNLNELIDRLITIVENSLSEAKGLLSASVDSYNETIESLSYYKIRLLLDELDSVGLAKLYTLTNYARSCLESIGLNDSRIAIEKDMIKELHDMQYDFKIKE